MFLSTFISLGWCLSWQGLRKHMRERSCIIYQAGTGERLQPFRVWMNAQQFPPAKICAAFGGSLAGGL